MSRKRVVFALGVIAGLTVVLGVLMNLMDGRIEKNLTGEKIGVVELTGVIKSSDKLLEQLAEFGKDDKIKAVIVRVDTPGGAVGPSQELYGEVMKLKRRKPVVASIGNIGASGGYYVASGASRIVANPGTITGSIGVIIEFYNYQQLLGKLGLKGDVIKSGEFKDAGSPLREMTKEERALMQGMIDDVHQQFVEAVAKGRGLKPEDVARIADGRVFSGRTARELKLVDELGNFNDAVDVAKRLAGISGDHKLVYSKESKNTWLELFKTVSDSEARSALLMLLSDLRVPAYLSGVSNLLVNGR